MIWLHSSQNFPLMQMKTLSLGSWQLNLILKALLWAYLGFVCSDRYWQQRSRREGWPGEQGRRQGCRSNIFEFGEWFLSSSGAGLQSIQIKHLQCWSVIVKYRLPKYTKYKEYAGDDPGLEGIESISFRRVCCDSIEDVDEDKKKSN